MGPHYDYSALWDKHTEHEFATRDVNATMATTLHIAEEGREELSRLPARRAASVKGRLLQLLAEADGPVSLRTAARELGPKNAQAAMRDLARAGWIIVTTRSRTGAAKPKRRKIARLLPIETEAQTEAARQLSDTQQRVIAALIEAGGSLPFAELVEAADSSAAPVTTLANGAISFTSPHNSSAVSDASTDFTSACRP